MRKGLLVVLVCLLALTPVLTVSAAEVAPKDIPPDHPAYKAVVGLVEQGYLGLYQDGTFQGSHPIDRYTLATVIAKILADIQSGRLVLPAEEMKTLRQLATEFRSELVEVAGRVNTLNQTQEKQDADLTVLREDGTKMLAEIFQIHGNIDKLTADLTKLGSDLDTVRAEAAQATKSQADADVQLRAVLEAEMDAKIKEAAAADAAADAEAAAAQAAAQAAATAKTEAAIAKTEAATAKTAADAAETATKVEALEKQLTGEILPQINAYLARNKALESANQELRSELESYRRSNGLEVEHLKQTNKYLMIGLGVVGLLALSK